MLEILPGHSISVDKEQFAFENYQWVARCECGWTMVKIFKTELIKHMTTHLDGYVRNDSQLEFDLS